MASAQTYLITGANRGIGRAVLTVLLARPASIVIAAVRSPSDASTSSLATLPKGEGSKLIVVKIDSASDTDARTAVEELQAKHGVEKLDVVLANAGICLEHGVGNLVDIPARVLREHVEVNGIGPLVLFQAVHPLLVKSASPKFVLIGSMNGSVAGMEKFPAPLFAYGASKAMAHYLIRKIHCEHEKEGLCAFVIDPGFTQSDLGNTGARMFGMPEAPVKLEDSAAFIVKQIDESTREKTSGRFPSLTLSGGEIEW